MGKDETKALDGNDNFRQTNVSVGLVPNSKRGCTDIIALLGTLFLIAFPFAVTQ